MAKYNEIFKKDKETQIVPLGQCKVQLVRGYTKDNNLYHRVDIISKDKIRLLSQFIKIENLGYYLHVASNNDSVLNTLYEKISFLIECVNDACDMKSIKKDVLINTLQEFLSLIEKEIR